MSKIIITGATSGIGRELAIQLAQKGNTVGLIGRRLERLEELAEEIGDRAYYRSLDVTDFETANVVYQGLADEMGGMDIMILNAGVGRDSLLPKWDSDKQTIDVNVSAFVHGAHFAFTYFRAQNKGHIVGMSSIASHLSSGRAAAYTASKHFISNYMTGLRQKANKLELDLVVSDIRPGYVKSEMTEKNKNMFWVATTEKAVRQMVTAIEKKKKRAYITKRWWLIATIARLTPQFVWDRLKF
ncbi:MAG: SDR family NAD(P)-dependent oxidoreductase [Balneolaceae bacterium]|nr:SDR family NAD(P)-dependent oxidoreductase [Balneolaceae bacterium]